MISSTGKLHEFISPSITTKQLFDLYQKTVGVDIWNSHYEKMQEQLRKQKDVNRNLRREIRQRMGESLNDLNYEQLEELMENVDNSLKLIRERKKMQEQLRKQKDVNRNLRKEIRQRMGESLNDLNYEQLEELMENVDNSLKLIRERKYKVIGNQIETYKKKVRNVEEIHRNLLLEFDARQENPYGLVEQEGDYNSMLGFLNGGPRILALRLQPNNHNHHHHHLHSGGGSDITTFALA
ncbi:Floral homeotic protein PMADS 1 [Datura stramonium]|uniref:Floral homeotic protein PMADS 1 n=1 Tax=Datura stramonium TaxID=4076 RepID=A0ABS8SJP4_DATST|nr:Floral homeotic protein PMADS 1 [Datura stramonium]